MDFWIALFIFSHYYKYYCYTEPVSNILIAVLQLQKAARKLLLLDVCVGPMQANTASMNSWVQHSCHAQKTLFGSGPLVLKIILPSLLPCSFNFWKRRFALCAPFVTAYSTSPYTRLDQWNTIPEDFRRLRFSVKSVHLIFIETNGKQYIWEREGDEEMIDRRKDTGKKRGSEERNIWP